MRRRSFVSLTAASRPFDAHATCATCGAVDVPFNFSRTDTKPAT